MRLLAIGGLVLLLITPAFAADEQPTPPAPLPSVKLPPDLDRVLRDYERAWQARDAKALATLFAEDGFVMSSGRPPVRGRKAIREAYANAGGQLALRALAYATNGSLGYIIGAFGQRVEGPDTGKFVLALRKGGGRWLIAADMDNSSQKPRPAVPPTPPVQPTPPALPPTPPALPPPPPALPPPPG